MTSADIRFAIRFAIRIGVSHGIRSESPEPVPDPKTLSKTNPSRRPSKPASPHRLDLAIMNTTEIDRLAAAIAALRPDWPLASLRTFITNDLPRHAYRDAAVALTWIATDPTTLTPKRVLEAGPWWVGVADTRNGTPTPPPLRSCPTCGAYVTEDNHDTEHCARRATQDAYTRGAAAVRAELAAARTDQEGQ